MTWAYIAFGFSKKKKMNGVSKIRHRFGSSEEKSVYIFLKERLFSKIAL